MKTKRVNNSVHFANADSEEITTADNFALRAIDADGNDLEPLLLRDASVLKASPFNLVSVGLLCDEGSILHFERGDSWFTYQGNRFPIEERGGLFIIHLDKVLQGTKLSDIRRAQAEQGYDAETHVIGEQSYCCTATFDLWHERLGHMSRGRLKFLFDTGAAEGLAVEGRKWKHDLHCKCSTCVAINNNRVHVGDTRKFADTVTHVGQVVVADVCGPFPESVEVQIRGLIHGRLQPFLGFLLPQGKI